MLGCGCCLELVERLLTLTDWRQLEFPRDDKWNSRFFRADPDHEGMVKDQQCGG